jgi:hypothetical protein
VQIEPTDDRSIGILIAGRAPQVVGHLLTPIAPTELKDIDTTDVEEIEAGMGAKRGGLGDGTKTVHVIHDRHCLHKATLRRMRNILPRCTIEECSTLGGCSLHSITSTSRMPSYSYLARDPSAAVQRLEHKPLRLSFENGFELDAPRSSIRHPTMGREANKDTKERLHALADQCRIDCRTRARVVLTIPTACVRSSALLGIWIALDPCRGPMSALPRGT